MQSTPAGAGPCPQPCSAPCTALAPSAGCTPYPLTRSIYALIRITHNHTAKPLTGVRTATPHTHTHSPSCYPVQCTPSHSYGAATCGVPSLSKLLTFFPRASAPRIACSILSALRPRTFQQVLSGTKQASTSCCSLSLLSCLMLRSASVTGRPTALLKRATCRRASSHRGTVGTMWLPSSWSPTTGTTQSTAAAAACYSQPHSTRAADAA